MEIYQVDNTLCLSASVVKITFFIRAFVAS